MPTKVAAPLMLILHLAGGTADPPSEALDWACLLVGGGIHVPTIRRTSTSSVLVRTSTISVGLCASLFSPWTFSHYVSPSAFFSCLENSLFIHTEQVTALQNRYTQHG
jgi:hypothetical protein